MPSQPSNAQITAKECSSRVDTRWLTENETNESHVTFTKHSKHGINAAKIHASITPFHVTPLLVFTNAREIGAWCVLLFPVL